ncbi:MAG TPA: metallopeptidase family protein [Candidatus Omnitrophota bacterium]|jgi:predicted Zn-dependent protease with MMP-like domain|nr:metallopeptidase family protein [Candidatus Omnitrophota bacterium]
MSTPSRLDELMREGEEALDAGEFDAALERFEAVLAGDPEHWGAALDRAETLHLLWRTREALRAVTALRPPEDEEDDADRADLEARIREVTGDFGTADGLFTEAHRLDPEHFPEPVRMNTEDFRAVLDEVLASLPEPIRNAVEEVPVVVQPKPTPAMAEYAPHITPEILGLFVGTSLGDKVSAGSGYADVVLLFQKNLEHAGTTAEEVAEEIRITLLHEYGHYLGFDEDAIEDLGLA